jgi:hypothetical protein
MLVIVVFVAIVAALLTAVVPTLIRLDRLTRVQRAAEIMADLAQQIFNNDAAIDDFRQRVGQNAGRLHHLAYPITSTDPNSCETNTYGNPQVTNWRSWGPFTGYAIATGTGLHTPIGIIQDDLLRFPQSASAGVIVMVINNADMEDVNVLDGYVDGADGINAGLIRWGTPATDGTVALGYTITIDNSC